MLLNNTRGKAALSHSTFYDLETFDFTSGEGEGNIDGPGIVNILIPIRFSQ